MSFIQSPLFVLLLLAAVAIAAVSFVPARFTGAWREIAQRYPGNRHPGSISFRDEQVELGLHGLTSIDAALDDDGFWMVFPSSKPNQKAECLMVPWDCIRFRRDKGQQQEFQIKAKKPIEFIVSAGLGNALQRRSDRYEVEDQL